MLDTEKPGIKRATKKIIKVLITSAKNPNVRMVIGRVRIMKIGFKKVLKKPRSRATNIAVIKLSTETLGAKYEASSTARPFDINLNKKFIIILYSVKGCLAIKTPGFGNLNPGVRHYFFFVFTLIFLGLAASFLGTVTLTIPFSISASALSDLTAEGREVV